MRTSVEVDGVVLTAEQVEQAYKKLHEPEPKPFEAGELVIGPSGEGVILHRLVVETLHRAWPSISPENILYVGLSNGLVFSCVPNRLTRKR
jgi:hypothetical protein